MFLMILQHGVSLMKFATLFYFSINRVWGFLFLSFKASKIKSVKKMGDDL